MTAIARYKTILSDDGQGTLRLLRSRLLVVLSVMYGLTMLLAAWLGGAFTAAAAANPLRLLSLLMLALVLAVLMASLARRVLAPAEELASASDRLRGLYNQARLDALLDPLTGLGNHRAFQEELSRQIEDARRNAYAVTLALIDVDDLKRVNDEQGHAAGDQLLGTMGRLIATAVRMGDRGFRVGGDEFVLILPHTDSATAFAIIRRLLAGALSGDSTRTGSPPFSFSAGISTFPEPSTDGGRLRRQADAALYWAKRHGRTDVQVFDPERHGAADDERSTPELAAAVLEIARSGALTPVYQAIYNLRTGEPTGFEGLVRPIEGNGFRDATSLFVAAEAADRTVELDMACIEVVAAGAKNMDPDVYLSVNISPRTLETDQFRVTDLLSRFAPHKLDPKQIVLELTEREEVEDVHRLRANLAACRTAGMRIAADDVGAGNAGLRLLSEIQFDIVKIDLSLVQGGVLRESALAVLGALRELTDRSGAVIVAEGVQTVEQLDVVRSLGLAAGQGYLLGYPAAEAHAEPIDLDALLAPLREQRLASSAPDQVLSLSA